MFAYNSTSCIRYFYCGTWIIQLALPLGYAEILNKQATMSDQCYSISGVITVLEDINDKTAKLLKQNQSRKSVVRTIQQDLTKAL